MKTTAKTDEHREEYDFASMEGGVRGKYAERYRQGATMVHLEPDVAAVFPTDAGESSLAFAYSDRSDTNDACVRRLLLLSRPD